MNPRRTFEVPTLALANVNLNLHGLASCSAHHIVVAARSHIAVGPPAAVQKNGGRIGSKMNLAMESAEARGRCHPQNIVGKSQAERAK